MLLNKIHYFILINIIIVNKYSCHFNSYYQLSIVQLPVQSIYDLCFLAIKVYYNCKKSLVILNLCK